MAQGSFSAQVRGWVTEKKARMVAVRNESAQRLIEIMQTPVAKGGNMPVDTGFLRNSLKATVGTANFSTVANPGGALSFSYDGGEVALVIAKAEINDTIEAVYTANYARVANYGGDNRAPRLFVNLAAQQWPQIVAQVAAEAEARNRR